MFSYEKAKQYENENLWLLAAKEWVKINKYEDARACLNIYMAVKNGDAERAGVPKPFPMLTDKRINWFSNDRNVRMFTTNPADFIGELHTYCKQ